MGASTAEQQWAQTNGVTIRHWARPVSLRVADGAVTGVEFEGTRPDAAGRLEGTGQRFALAADQVFKAIGQLLVASDLEADARSLLDLEGGRIRVDAERRSSLPGVWAGGDCAAGGQDLTVVAVEDGKRAAASIDRHLRAKG